jgi:hypothetical protein
MGPFHTQLEVRPPNIKVSYYHFGNMYAISLQKIQDFWTVWNRSEIAKNSLEQSSDGLFLTVLNRPEIWAGNSGYGQFGSNCPELIIFFFSIYLFLYINIIN